MEIKSNYIWRKNFGTAMFCPRRRGAIPCRMKTTSAGAESSTVLLETEDGLAERRPSVRVPFPAPVDKTQAIVFLPSGVPKGEGGYGLEPFPPSNRQNIIYYRGERVRDSSAGQRI